MIIKKQNKKVTFKKNLLFRSCTSKINDTFVDNAEDLDLDIVRSMYNLLQYSNNYCMTSRSFWHYHRDEVNDMRMITIKQIN